MTKKQALIEAQKRWGQKAIIDDRKVSTKYMKRHTVGCLFMGIAYEIKGNGETWEKAFQDADRKAIR